MKNQTGKYLKYAIGEIVLVVIGILIALQINNWNEGRKENILKQKLVASLIEDFEYNKAALQFTKNRGDSLFSNMKTFHQLTISEVPMVSVDSLRRLARSYFRGNTYNPNLTTYEEAKSTGNLSLLNNKALSQQFTVFNRSFHAYSNLSGEGRYAFFNGGTWELRKTIDISLISTGQSIEDSSMEEITLPYNEYKAIIDMPITKAALRNSYVLRRNINGLYRTMDRTITEILDILYKMQE